MVLFLLLVVSFYTSRPFIVVMEHSVAMHAAICLPAHLGSCSDSGGCLTASACRAAEQPVAKRTCRCIIQYMPQWALAFHSILHLFIGQSKLLAWLPDWYLKVCFHSELSAIWTNCLQMLQRVLVCLCLFIQHLPWHRLSLVFFLCRIVYCLC